MNRAVAIITRLIRNQEGQDLLEYALLATLVAVGAIVAVTTVGNAINSVFWQAIAANVASAI